MIDVAEALRIVLSRARPLPAEVTALASMALGQVLAMDVPADGDSPPFTKSMMDGFAVRSADLAAGPCELRVVGEVAAGAVPTAPVEAGQAIAIYTGAALPPGADTVVRGERTQRIDDGRVKVLEAPVKPGHFVIPQGQEYRTGDVLIRAGSEITPTTFGICAAVGKTTVSAVARAKVCVLATGNELVEANRKLRPGQIRNSNGPMLMGQAVRAGALPRYLGISSDDPKVLASYIREGLEIANVLILAGGVSAGKFDLVPQVLMDNGVEIQFHHVRVKPGKPLLFGTVGDKLVFGLPGNPLSAFVGFELFVRPAIRAMTGHADAGPMIQKRSLTEPLAASNDRPTYHPAKLDGTGVRPLPWFGSADLRALLPADALIALPAGDWKFEAGQPVDVVVM